MINVKHLEPESFWLSKLVVDQSEHKNPCVDKRNQLEDLGEWAEHTARVFLRVEHGESMDSHNLGWKQGENQGAQQVELHIN